MKDPNDTLAPWVRWMLNHKMRFVVIALVWLSFPFQVLSYASEALDDIRSTIWNLK
jgi:hypothetical protein